MIHPSSMIKYLDINTGGVFNTTIDELFKHYIENVKILDSDKCESEIVFNLSHNIKTCDWYGWTQLLKIKKVPVKQWTQLSIHVHGSSLILSTGSVVPSYDPTNPTCGFHGEIKYPFELKSIESLNQDDSIRAWRYVEFAKRYRCECGKLYSKLHINDVCDICKKEVRYDDKLESDFWHPISVKTFDDSSSYGYQITTGSGFCNINNFHLYTKNDKEKNIGRHVK